MLLRRSLAGVASVRTRLAPRTRPRRAPAASAAAAATASAPKGRVVFLGTPAIAASVLGALMDAAEAPNACFELTGVVSQPGRPRGRGRKKGGPPPPSEVEALARERGVPDSAILTPASARDESFLDALEALSPDLCVTAAYGNVLPQRFLDIPKRGTLNIHPSLLPAFRGAAPVPRALEAGVSVTGVTVAYTVLAMDAGPVLCQREVEVGPDERSPELLDRLFKMGTEDLVERMPAVLDGSAQSTPQDGSLATHAAKMSKHEGVLDPRACEAAELHNRVRAFAGHVGTKLELLLPPKEEGGERERMVVGVVETRVGDGAAEGGPGALRMHQKKAMRVTCAGGTALDVLEVQPPSKKPMPAVSFWNGLRGQAVEVAPPAEAAA